MNCAHCNGKMVAVIPAKGSPFRRCETCGRDDIQRPATAPLTGKCPATGCPGTVALGRCGCCEKRAKWLEENTPKRQCEICTGAVIGKGYRKYCAACGPLVQKAQVAKSHSPKAKAAK